MPWQVTKANVFATGVWLTVLSLAVGFVCVLTVDWESRQFTLPFLFWTIYGALLVGSTACAIALPKSQSVFYRALVFSQLALTTQTNGYSGTVFEQLARWLPRDWQRKLYYSSWSDGREWMRTATCGMLYLAVGLACASLAWAIARRWPATITQRFQFRLWHMFVLSGMLACTFAVLRADQPMGYHLTILANAVLRLTAVIVAASDRRAATLALGYLAGDIGWSLLIESHALGMEWEGLLSAEFRGSQTEQMLIGLLMPIYAGMATGVLAAALHHPQGATEKPRV